jgi:hypothetical protein
MPLHLVPSYGRLNLLPSRILARARHLAHNRQFPRETTGCQESTGPMIRSTDKFVRQFKRTCTS